MADQRPKENQNHFIERFKRRNDTYSPHYLNNFYRDCCVESSAKPKGWRNSLSQSRFLYIEGAEKEALADRHRWGIALKSVGVAPERVILPRIAPQGRQPVNLVGVDPSSHKEPFSRKAGSSLGTQPRLIFVLNNEKKKKSYEESDAVASRVAVRKKAQRKEDETPAELRAHLEADTSEEDLIPPTRQPPASAESRGQESQAKKYLKLPRDAPKSAMEKASVSVVQRWQMEEQARMWTDPAETVAQAFLLLSSETWEKKVAGLNSLRALLQNHGEALKPDLHGTCLAVVKEVKNLRAAVSLVAIETLGDMYVHLKRAMDKEVEWTAHVLLLKASEINTSAIRQAANLALGDMVQHCSPARVMNALLLAGLSHRSVAVRSCMAQHLEVLTDILGPKRLLKGKKLTGCFLVAVSKMAQDSGLEVRSHGRNILQKIIDDDSFPKMWERFVPLKDKECLKMVIHKLKSWTFL